MRTKHKKDGAIPSTFARDTPAPPGATQEEQMTYLGNAWTDSLAKDRVLKPLNTAFKRALSRAGDIRIARAISGLMRVPALLGPLLVNNY